MPFADYWSEVVGTIPKIDPLFAQKIVNRAWDSLKDERLWSFLRGVGILQAPQIIATGTVSVTQFSAIVTLNATANAALNNLTNPLIGQRQIRVGLGGGPVYNILSYSNNLAQITLDRPYQEATQTGSPYQVYRCYFSPADQTGTYTTDFRMWTVLLNPIDGYAIVGENLRLTRQEIDARDPTRGAQDLAYTMAAYSVDANGMPIHEMWPHPTSQRTYVGLYRKRGQLLSNSVDLPASFPRRALVERSLQLGCDWAIANAGRFAELKGVNWALLKAESKREAEKFLQQARLADDDLMTENFLPQLRDYLMYPPIDSDFAQSHDMGAWFDS